MIVVEQLTQPDLQLCSTDPDLRAVSVLSNKDLIDELSFLASQELREHSREGRLTVAMIRPRLDQLQFAQENGLSDKEMVDLIRHDMESRGFDILYEHSQCLPEEYVEDFYQHVRPVLESIPAKYGIGKENHWEEFVHMMTAGPLSIFLLTHEEGPAVEQWRQAIGATDPTKAKEGTIRRTYAQDLRNNVVHGSGTPEEVWPEVEWATFNLMTHELEVRLRQKNERLDMIWWPVE